jgi:hypothetical protein
MQYDQSWMGYGLIGDLEAGTISAVAGLLLYLLVNGWGRRHGWNELRQIGWSYLLTLLLTASGDIWNLLYFDYNSGLRQSLQLLRAELALVHDPDSMGARVMWECFGAALGIYIAWALCRGGWRRHFSRHKNPSVKGSDRTGGPHASPDDATASHRDTPLR